MALVTKILQIILRDLIYLIVFLPRRQTPSYRLEVECYPAVVYEILRLCVEYLTKGTVYCTFSRFDL